MFFLYWFQIAKKKTKEEEAAEAEEKAKKEAKKRRGFFTRFTSFFSQQNFLRELKDLFSQAFKRRDDDPVSRTLPCSLNGCSTS